MAYQIKNPMTPNFNITQTGSFSASGGATSGAGKPNRARIMPARVSGAGAVA